MLIMDRSTTLQRLSSVIGFSVLIAILYLKADLFDYNEKPAQTAYILIIISSSFLFYLLNKQPFSKIFFDSLNDQLTYYRFLMFKISLPLSQVVEVNGQTKISHEYGGGKSRTIYTTDVFLITDDMDYQIRVFERAKIQEFENKFNMAKARLAAS
jgi:hypothetical protein